VYANSAATASALVVNDRGRVLLARRAGEPRAGCWDAPGGFLEEWEHPLDALRRELREETGLEIEPLDFLGVWVDRYGDAPDARATLNLYWTARAVSGEEAPADDVSELRWFARDELPPADALAFRNNAQALAEWSRSAEPQS
jgi:8-oxo-dGTP diphosphatase